jgi:hypothetical protein
MKDIPSSSQFTLMKEEALLELALLGKLIQQGSEAT